MTTPHCDIATGKIYGCAEGTKQWFHEEGHLKFNQLPKASTLRLFQSYAFFFWMFAITLSILNKYMIALALPTFIFYMAVEIREEAWCNKYAKRMMGEGN